MSNQFYVFKAAWWECLAYVRLTVMRSVGTPGWNGDELLYTRLNKIRERRAK